MAAPGEATPGSFSPAAQARRERAAAKKARFRAAAEQAVVETWSPHVSEAERDPIEGAVSEALALAPERAAARGAVRTQDPHAAHAADQRLRARKAELRSGGQASQATPKGLSEPEWREQVERYLIRLDSDALWEVEQGDWYASLAGRARRAVDGILDDVREAERTISYEQDEAQIDWAAVTDPYAEDDDWDDYDLDEGEE